MPAPLKRDDRSRGEQVLRVLRVARALRTGATVEDLARELQCTRRTIYRDVELLQKLHAPIEKREGAYYVMTGPIPIL